MSHDDTPNAQSSDESATSQAPSTDVTRTVGTPGRRDAVREKAQQVHVRQSRVRIARRATLITGAVAAVAVVAVVVAWTIGGAVSRPQLSPQGADEGGFAVTAISGAAALGSLAEASTPTAEVEGDATASPTPTATASAPVEIHVYVDYLSPQAREWQLANSAQLSTWVADGAATLSYHPVAMLTAKSNGTKYSLRAANAAACVATYAPDAFFAFSADLLDRQPAIDSDGFSDKVLADIAQANGGDDLARLRECIETEAFASWVKATTEAAVAGIEGTDGLALTGNSLITVNGQAYVGEAGDPAEFSQFVLTSASGKAAKAQSATSTPTPTPTASVTP